MLAGVAAGNRTTPRASWTSEGRLPMRRLLRHLVSALTFMLCLLAVCALLFLVVGGLLWLVAEWLPVWASIPLVLVLLFALCWLYTGDD